MKIRYLSLIEAARSMVFIAKAPLFLWVEAIATACDTQNRSMIRRSDTGFEHSCPVDPTSRIDFFNTRFKTCANPPSFNTIVHLRGNFNEVIALVLVDSTGSPSSTTVDKDAPSPIALLGNDMYFGVPIQVFLLIIFIIGFYSYNCAPDHQISEHNSKWTKDHPLENIIGKLARPVSTRLQLYEQALFYYYDAFLTAVEPKTYKDALTQACWIEATQRRN
ncbi:hypothetical protein Tco_0450493 [Tanacetum coccineum]